MAVDLVLRLCQVDEDDGGLPGAGKAPGEPGYDPATAHIAVQPFYGGLISVLGGYHTVAQMKAFFSMDTEQSDNLDVLWAKITSAAEMDNRIGRVMRFKTVLNLWEMGTVSGYDTPDGVQIHLMALDTGF